MNEQIHSDTILDTIESFLDTCPDLNTKIEFSERTTGENETVRMQEVTIGDQRYLVVVKQLPTLVSEAILVAEYEAYLEAQALPKECAEELLFHDITDEQRAWLSDFITRWNNFFRSH
jgi:hypothetical protein